MAFADLGVPGDFVDLKVLDAELRDGVISGHVINNSFVAVVETISVHVACFQESNITASQRAVVDTEVTSLG